MKRFSLICLFCVLVSILCGCANNSVKSKNTSTNATLTTPTATPTHSATASPTTIPIPDALSLLSEYYTSHQDSEDYSIKYKPKLSYGTLYEMALVFDEAPQSNGTAFVRVKKNSKTVEIDFSSSSFMGAEICSPKLIRSVVQSTAEALVGSASDNRDVISDVLVSYNESEYTSPVFANNYAFVFSPSTVYKTQFYAIDLDEYASSINKQDYKVDSYKSVSAQINEGTEYSITGMVLNVENGAYRNSYGTYKCIMITIEGNDGNNYRIAQFLERVPFKCTIGQMYTFFGTSMFDTKGDLLIYLLYVE